MKFASQGERAGGTTVAALTRIVLAGLITLSSGARGQEAGSAHDYPTILRVEYVQECVNANGGAFALLYQCSCALDRLRAVYETDDFVEVTTFAKYAALSGERGGEFRDSDRARSLVRKFRAQQSEAYRACGVVTGVRAGTTR